MKTLRARLLLGTALGTGLVLSISALALYMIVRAAMWAEFDEALASKCRSLATLVERDGDEIDVELKEDNLPEFKPSQHAEYYQLWVRGGRVLARSSSLGERNLDQLQGRPDEPAFATTRLPDGRPGRSVGITFEPPQEADGASGPVPHEPIEVTIVVGRDTVAIGQALNRLRMLLVFGCAAAMLVSVAVLAWLVQEGLRPLQGIAAEIATIGENDLSSRLSPADAPAELTPVVARLNDLLARLDSAFTRERAFTADVAHELRTPLAGLRLTLEVSLSKERAATAYREAMGQSLAISVQMQRMVENLLELARADAGQVDVANETIDLTTLLRDRWAHFSGRSAERRLEVTWELPESCIVATDLTKVGLVLNNILDNAVTYTEPGGQVAIAVYEENGQVNVRVTNTGNRLAETDVHRVFDRFWRGDAARTSDSDERRYGLGLPLCRKLITLLGGSISASTGSDRTFVISLSFPSQLAKSLLT